MPRPDAPAITPEMRVGDLLRAYPELEAVLVAQAPAFANLKNPVLRRTVAKVATLSQAARVGGIDVRSLVLTLRRAAGVDDDGQAGSGIPPSGDSHLPAGEASDAPPAWYDASRVVATVDADTLLRRGEHPLGETQRHVQSLDCHAIVCVDAGFVPAPLVDAFRKQGYVVATFRVGEDRYRTAIMRAAGSTAQ